ncbi:MAG: lysylphosphatidylglycerol synthase transmembrane domain-containing protein [Pseudomonadota bacterium]
MAISKRAVVLLKVGVSLALVALIAANVSASDFVAILRSVKLPALGAALLAVALTPVVASLRWHHGCRAFNITLPRAFLARATYSALFVGQFLPAGIGVDSARLGLLWKAGTPVPAGLGSIACDRLAGIAAILALAVAGLPFAPVAIPPLALWAGAALALGASAAAWVVSGMAQRLQLDAGPPRWLAQLARVVVAARRALVSPHMAAAFCWGVVIHLLSILGLLLISRSLGYELAFLPLLSISSIAVFASLLPISFNGWGVREGALVLGLSLLQVPRESALLISVIYGLFLAIASLPGAIFVATSSSRPVEGG